VTESLSGTDRKKGMAFKKGFKLTKGKAVAEMGTWQIFISVSLLFKGDP